MNRSRKLVDTWVQWEADDVIRSQAHCPIARAIRESSDDLIAITVVRRRSQDKKSVIAFIAFTSRGTGVRSYFNMPPDARRFVEAFDQGKDPGSFRLVLGESMIFRSYRTLFGIGNAKADDEPPIPRGPRRRPVFAT